MQEFAPDATTTPAGSVHQHRCGIKKSSLKINFFFEHQIFFWSSKPFAIFCGDTKILIKMFSLEIAQWDKHHQRITKIFAFQKRLKYF